MRIIRRQEGASAVEFALLAPLLFALLFGIIGFGFAFAQELALSNAARQGARFGVVQNRTCDDIRDEVQGSGGSIQMPGSAITVVTSRSDVADPCGLTSVCDGGGGQSLVVTASYTSSLTFPFIPDLGSREGVGVFRCEAV